MISFLITVGFIGRMCKVLSPVDDYSRERGVSEGRLLISQDRPQGGENKMDKKMPQEWQHVVILAFFLCPAGRSWRRLQFILSISFPSVSRVASAFSGVHVRRNVNDTLPSDDRVSRLYISCHEHLTAGTSYIFSSFSFYFMGISVLGFC